MHRRPYGSSLPNGAIIAGMAVVASLLAPWFVFQATNSSQPRPPSTSLLATAASTSERVPVTRVPVTPQAEMFAPATAAQPPTLQPSPTPSETTLPTATRTPTPTPSPTGSSTPSAAAPPTAPPTALPTATPSWTPTPIPVVVVKPLATATPTLRPTRRPASTRAAPTPAAASPGAATPAAATQPPSDFISAPAPVAPAQGTFASGIVRFAWQPTGPLPEGGGYETVWWNSDEQPTAARSFQAAGTGTSIEVNLDPLYRAGQFTGQQIFWTVLVVRLNPYERWMSPSDGERGTFFYVDPISTR